jgi:hypothetical protein
VAIWELQDAEWLAAQPSQPAASLSRKEESQATGVAVCWRCGGLGHLARECKAMLGGSYGDAHDNCRVLWGKANLYLCIECGGEARHWAYDGTDPTDRSHKLNGGMRWSRWPEFYMPMCPRCHVRHDVRARKDA